MNESLSSFNHGQRRSDRSARHRSSPKPSQDAASGNNGSQHQMRKDFNRHHKNKDDAFKSKPGSSCSAATYEENRPFVDFVINNIKCRSLVDTGAQKSLLPSSSFVPDDPKDNVKMRSADGKPMKTHGVLNASVVLGEERLIHSFVIADVEHPLISIDLLEKGRCVIDVATNVLTFPTKPQTPLPLMNCNDDSIPNSVQFRSCETSTSPINADEDYRDLSSSNDLDGKLQISDESQFCIAATQSPTLPAGLMKKYPHLFSGVGLVKGVFHGIDEKLRR